LRSLRFYAALLGGALIVLGVAAYVMVVTLPAFQGPVETIIVVGAFAAPMAGYLLIVPGLITSGGDWRLMSLTGIIFAYYMVVLFIGS